MKRRLDKVEIKYSIMEVTSDKQTTVEFVPQNWLIPATKNGALKEREVVKFYYPRQLPKQSKDTYLMLVKQSKFTCMKPVIDGKWDMKEGRTLKIGIGDLEEALKCQQFFIDYFGLTGGETSVQATNSKKVTRRKKKVVPKQVLSESEDDDDEDIVTVSNYNNHFGSGSTTLQTLDEGHANGILSDNINQLINNNFFEHETIPHSGHISAQSIQTVPQQSIEDAFDLKEDLELLNPSNEVFLTINLPHTETSADQTEQVVLAEEYLPDNCSQFCCKGHQKILNKIDYMQKKVAKDLSLLRAENSMNRKLLLELLDRRGPSDEKISEQADENESAEQSKLDVVELDELNEKFKSTFPVKDCDFIIDFNKSLRDDQKFADYIFTKLAQIKGDDEVKTARKMMKLLCDGQCLKDFTWHGTKRMKSFENLHLIVQLMTKVLDEKYPGCDSLDIVSKVVKQRTKSAKDVKDQTEKPAAVTVGQTAESMTAGVESVTAEIGSVVDTTEENALNKDC